MVATVIVVGIAVALSLAWRAMVVPSSDITARSISVALDVAVGLTFVAVGALAHAARAERAWVVTTGLAWMTATWLPALSGLHQGLLLIALLLFPRGTIRSWRDVAAVATGALLMSGILTQPVAAVIFLASAALILHRVSPVQRTATATAWAAGLIGIVLAAAWAARNLDPTAFRPVIGLRIYEIALLAAAGVLAVGMRAHGRPEVTTDTVLRRELGTGLPGLERLLSDALGDSALRIDRGEHAAVASVSPLLDDPGTRRAIQTSPYATNGSPRP